MISTGDLKRGVVIEADGQLFQVMEYQHIKMGRGGAQVRMRLRNIRSGAVVDKTVQAGQKWPRVHLDQRGVQFLYEESGNYFFMDQENFEQIALTRDQMGEAVSYLKDGMLLQVSMNGDEPIGLELPITIDLKIVETEPGFRGDTAAGGTKPATLETGLVVNIPLFVNNGETIRVDTRTGSYIERVTS
ncbi:MAG: elongation factor P [Chloroflexi bacterium]|nr:elongation factor P [Chloroflexota bacterium]